MQMLLQWVGKCGLKLDWWLWSLLFSEPTFFTSTLMWQFVLIISGWKCFRNKAVPNYKSSIVLFIVSYPTCLPGLAFLKMLDIWFTPSGCIGNKIIGHHWWLSTDTKSSATVTEEYSAPVFTIVYISRK